MFFKVSFNKVLIATWLGWLFDGMDSSLYPLVANQAINELIGPNNPQFGQIATGVLAVFLIGWATGGILFGFLGDKIGRAKALSFSILTYALFTGLSGLAQNWPQLAVYRFLGGLGIGGEWALGVALLAESTKPEKRIMSSAFLATGFSVGYCIAVFVNLLLSPFGWRAVFFFGILPAFLVFYIMKKIKEPEVWTHVEHRIKTPLEIFKEKYSYNLWIAFLLGVTFSIGSWTCVNFWLPVWIERELGASLNQKTVVIFISMLAHAIGCFIAGPLLLKYKRRTVLMASYLLCFIISAFMYSYFHSFSFYVLIFSSLLGFFFGIIPAAFAIYFPELFPTRIRSTAKGFCFSTARFVTVGAVLYSGYLVSKLGGSIGTSAALMSVVFLLGAIVSFFAKETDKEKLPA